MRSARPTIHAVRRAAVTAAAAAMALACIGANAHEQPLTYDRVQLSVTAGEEVENDTLIIVMFTQEQDTDQASAAAAVNDAMRWALGQAEQRAPAVRAQTLGYRTTPVYNRQTLTGWRVRQSLRLEGRDFDAVSELVGDLQDRLAIESVSYAISPEGRAAAEERLIAEALQRFQARAELVAKGLGRSDFRVVQVDVNTQSASPAPRLARAAVMADAAAPGPPALEGGVQRVTVFVSGTVELEVP